jgi:hypothetical protein
MAPVATSVTRLSATAEMRLIRRASTIELYPRARRAVFDGDWPPSLAGSLHVHDPAHSSAADRVSVPNAAPTADVRYLQVTGDFVRPLRIKAPKRMFATGSRSLYCGCQAGGRYPLVSTEVKVVHDAPGTFGSSPALLIPSDRACTRGPCEHPAVVTRSPCARRTPADG